MSKVYVTSTNLKLIHVLKESSASSALKTKKPLMLQVFKFLCVPMAQIFTTS